MRKEITTSAVLICIMFVLTACNSKNTQSNTISDQGKIKVVVTFNAMREFAAAVGKDKIDIVTMIPDGTEPHDFEPKAKDLAALSTASVFVYNGFGMESWVDETLKAVDNKKLAVVEASKGSKPIENLDSEEVREHGQYDPHLWLCLKGAENDAKNIRDALIKVDPTNKDYYEKNFSSFALQLNSLHDEYTQKFNTVSGKNFVTGHAAFAYLCREYGLKQDSVEDTFAEGEPSAKKLKDLTDYCKKNNIKTVFMEDMVSPKVSNTLASEVGAKVQKIHTLESKEDNSNYIESMKENLDMIYNSLK